MCIKPKSINRTFEEKPPLFHFRGNGCFTTGTLYVLFVSVGLCVPGVRISLLPALVRRLDSGSEMTGQKSRQANRALSTPLLRPDSYKNQVSFHLRRWLDLTFILFLLHFFIIPLINVSNVPTDKSLKLYILYNKRVKNYLKNSHYYDCHRNEWLLPHLARLYLHAVFRKQNLSELNLWKMQKVSNTHQHYMTWFEYFFVEIIFVWSCNKL